MINPFIQIIPWSGLFVVFYYFFSHFMLPIYINYDFETQKVVVFFFFFSPKTTAKITTDVCNIALSKGTWNEGPEWNSWFHCPSACFQTKKKWSNNYHSFSIIELLQTPRLVEVGCNRAGFLHLLHKPCLGLAVSWQSIAWRSIRIHPFYPGWVNYRKKSFHAKHMFYCLVVHIACFLTALLEDYLLTIKTYLF